MSSTTVMSISETDESRLARVLEEKNFSPMEARQLAILTIERAKKEGKYPSVIFALTVKRQLVAEGGFQSRGLTQVGLAEECASGFDFTGDGEITTGWVERQLAARSSLRAGKIGMTFLPLGLLIIGGSEIFLRSVHTLSANIASSVGIFSGVLGFGAICASFYFRTKSSSSSS